jgi:hypothetical protein
MVATSSEILEYQDSVKLSNKIEERYLSLNSQPSELYKFFSDLYCEQNFSGLIEYAERTSVADLSAAKSNFFVF